LLTALTYVSLISEVDNLTKQKCAKQDMKMISKKYCQNMKNFVEQISIKFGGFIYLIKMN